MQLLATFPTAALYGLLGGVVLGALIGVLIGLRLGRRGRNDDPIYVSPRHVAGDPRIAEAAPGTRETLPPAMPAGTPHERPLPQDDAGSEGPAVLLVDDRMELLAMHAAYLRKHGYRILTAENATAALACARAYHPSIIVLDHSMPDRTGVEVTRELKSDAATADIPILMMTAHSYGAVGAAAMAAGCAAFLPKPVEPSRLLREVATRIRA